MNPTRYLFYKTIFIVIFSIIYSFLEVKTPFFIYINPYIYRIIYFIIFFTVSLVPNILTTFSLFFYSMTLEDVFYWILDNKLPFSYAWYYPVIDHIPLVDVAEIIIATILLEINRVNIRVPDFHTDQSCHMMYYFFHGKTHDLYGLLLLMFFSAIIYIFDIDAYIRLISVIEIIVASDVFVDLWSHCFHH